MATPERNPKLKRIEATVDAGELAGIRDALREIGISTMSVVEFNSQKQDPSKLPARRAVMRSSHQRLTAKVSVVAPDRLTDTVIMTFISGRMKKPMGDDRHLVPSIERVVRLDMEKSFENGV